MDPLNIARYGMMAAEGRLAASASQAATWNGDDAALASQAVQTIEAKQQFLASVRVARLADDLWRALMDLQTHG